MSCIVTNNDSKQNNNVIYGLLEPITKEIRYVGKAINLSSRIRAHYEPNRLMSKTHKNNWLNKLINNNEEPIVVVLEVCERKELLNEAEIKWIAHYRGVGCDLTNGTDGGDGGQMSPESITKMKETKRKNPQKPHWLGKNLSDEHKKNLSEAKKGKKLSDEHKKKLSEAQKNKNTWSKGRKLTKDVRVNMS